MADVSNLVSRINDMQSGRGEQFKHKRRWTFSLEPGRGETYRNQRATLYGHNTYPRGSVLAGQPQRVFIEQWDDWTEARAALDEVKKQVKGFKFDDYGEQGGSSHIPTDVLTRHLPDDTDY
jgi:hypothetical protein